MPDGRTHGVITLVSGAATGVSMYLGHMQPEYILAASLGYLVTLDINPDLDLNRRFPMHKPSEWVKWLLFWPYSKLIPHRSPLSHLPILGTALRVAYVGAFLLLILRALGISIEVTQPYIHWFLYAMTVSDAFHCLADLMSTSFKRMRISWR